MPLRVLRGSFFFLAVALALAAPSAFAQADYAREQRWADEITPAIIVGGAVQL
ncbi:MAG: hypothetical protein JWO70_3600, partial [Betaproteobacteria bacterium]|nr:hypothetical protein [Betaproteobacteria bacterium]